MNPLVEQMRSNDVETRLLEDLFEQEVKCQSPHKVAILPGCSREVVSVNINSCDGKSTLYCSVADESGKRAIENRIHKCVHCKRNIAECWTIRPI